MSTPDISGLVESTNNLTNTVMGKMAQIDSKLNQANSHYQQLMDNIQSDFPFYALTRNQQLKFADEFSPQADLTHPDGFMLRNSKVVVELFETVVRSQEPAEQSLEQKALFNDVLGTTPKHMYTDFNIIKITFNDPVDLSSNYSIFQGPMNRLTALTHGAFIKVLLGECAFGHSRTKRVPNDGKWHEMIEHRDMASNLSAAYEHGPHIAGVFGTQILVALPATVAGKVPVGRWGYFNKPVFKIESDHQPKVITE